jgi:hypothetical protein
VLPENEKLCKRTETRQPAHHFNHLYNQALNFSRYAFQVVNPTATNLLGRILASLAAVFSFLVMIIVQASQNTNRAVTTLSSSLWTEYEEVFLFTKQNYKLKASIGYSSSLMWQRLVVLDTGAGPNCVSKSALPPGTHEPILPPPKIRILGAGGGQLPIAGTITLTVRFGPYAVKSQFLVCDSLQVDYILGTEFIDRHVQNIQVQDRFVELIDGTEVPILRSSFKNVPLRDDPIE